MQTKLAHPKGTLELHELSAIFPPMDAIEYADLVEDIKNSGLREDITLFEGKILDGGNRYRACLDASVKPTFVNFNPDIDGKSPAEFVMAKNFKRRHLSASQKAAIATAMLPYFEKEAAARKQSTQFKAAPEPQPEAPKQPEQPKANVIEGDFGTEHVNPPEEEQPAAPPPAPPETPKPVAKNGPKPGSAAEAVAKVFGTSGTMVRLAKRIQKADVDLFAEVLNGKTTINRAIEILDAREKQKKEEAKNKEDEKQFQAALDEIGDKYGTESEIYKAIKGRKVLKKKGDVIKFAGMTVKATKAIVHLIALGWDLDKAQRYLDGKATPENTVEDLCNIAIARGKPADEPFNITVGKWVITLSLQA